jgi:hypothetical protein
MVERLLLWSLLIIAGVFMITAIVTALAPFIAVGLTLFIAWKLRPKRSEGGQPALIDVTTDKSPR